MLFGSFGFLITKEADLYVVRRFFYGIAVFTSQGVSMLRFCLLFLFVFLSIFRVWCHSCDLNRSIAVTSSYVSNYAARFV